MVSLSLLAVVAGVVSLPTDAATQDESSEVVGIVLTPDKVKAGSDGWLQFADGSKQWVNNNCRQQHESAGTAVKVLSWKSISEMQNRPAEPCDSPAGDAGTDVVGLVLTPDKVNTESDGWVEFTDGSKQWVNKTCRQVLESAGTAVEKLSWKAISEMSARSARSCRSLMPVNQEPGSTETTAPVTTPEPATEPEPTDPDEPTTTTTAPATEPEPTDPDEPTTTTTAPATEPEPTDPGAPTTTTAPPKAPSSGPVTLGSGVNFASGEYWCVSGYDVFEHEFSNDQLARQMADLGIKTVRLPLNEHCWLGGDKFGYIKPHLRGESYRSEVRQLVGALNAKGMTVVLDLHWNGANGQEARGQKKMADADHAIEFWSSVAGTFKSNPNVVFDLYNEPHNISWECWRDGCSVDGWQTAGMQTLVNAVRNTGANQPIILNGLDWGGDLRGWLDHVPSDPQNKLIAGFHAYNRVSDGSNVYHKRCSDEGCWAKELRSIVDAGYGVVIGEAGQDVGSNGCSTDFLKRLFTWSDKNGIPYLGWSYNPHGCSSPALLTSYDGSLTPAGQVLASHLK
jgi:hypothetical protein